MKLPLFRRQLVKYPMTSLTGNNFISHCVVCEWCQLDGTVRICHNRVDGRWKARCDGNMILYKKCDDFLKCLSWRKWGIPLSGPADMRWQMHDDICTTRCSTRFHFFNKSLGDTVSATVAVRLRDKPFPKRSIPQECEFGLKCNCRNKAKLKKLKTLQKLKGWKPLKDKTLLHVLTPPESDGVRDVRCAV